MKKCIFCETYKEVKEWDDTNCKGRFKYAVGLISYEKIGLVTSRMTYEMGRKAKPNYCPNCGKKLKGD